MGKGQRTKGNVKPSNSGRTAELLASASSSTIPLIGFSALSSETIEKSNDDTNDIQLEFDADMRMVLKKMMKKDCVTKVKALKEFAEYCQNKDENTIKCLLPLWTKLYNKLAVDNDWRVREMTHKAHYQLVSRVGRNIAPHVKQLMPIWLTSQYDPYSPAASAARLSFTCAFPHYKQSEALAFAKESIISYVKDMIIIETPQTMGDPKVTSVEENEAKYNRLVTVSLQGLTALINSVPSSLITEIETLITDLINNGKFWKIAKAKDSLMRSSIYKLISCLCQYIPNLIRLNPTKICSLTLACLDESDPIVAVALWEASLCAIITIDDIWSHVNFKKAFLPQFNRILRSGGRGNASVLFPNLLPLLSRIPNDILDDSIRFYTEFFASLQQGIITVKVQSECNAIVCSYMECLRYCLTHNVMGNDEKSLQFSKNLINTELSKMISLSFESHSQVSSSNFYTEIIDLIIFLKNGKNANDLALSKTIVEILKKFALQKVKSNDFDAFPRLSRLLTVIGRDVNAVSAKKEGKKIRFRRESDEQLNTQFNQLKISTNEFIKDEDIQRFIHELTESIIVLLNDDKFNINLLTLFLDIMKLHSKDSIGQLFSYDKSESITTFWSLHLKQWFERFKLNESFQEKDNGIAIFVDIAFLICLMCDDCDDRCFILGELLNSKDWFIFEKILSLLINDNIKMHDFLQTETFGKAIVNVSLELIDQSIDDSDSRSKDLDILWKIIKHGFQSNLIKSVFIEEIIENFRLAIQKKLSVNKVEHLLNFTCNLALQLFHNYEMCSSSSAKSLLNTLFTLNCEMENERLRESWIKGVEVILKSTGVYIGNDSLITNLALKIRSYLQGKVKKIESVQLIYECAINLIQCVVNADINDDADNEISVQILSNPNVYVILELMFLPNTEWIHLHNCLSKWPIHSNWLKGNLLWDVRHCNMITDIRNAGDSFIYSASVIVKIMQKLLSDNESHELSFDINELLTSQLKYLLIANGCLKAFGKRLCDSTKIDDSLKEIMKSFNELSLAPKIAENMIDASKGVEHYFIIGLHELMNFIPDGVNIKIKPNLELLTYEEIATFENYAKCCDNVLLKEITISSLHSFLCTENYTDINGGIGFLSIIYSCLKNIDSSVNLDENVCTLIEALCGIKSSSSELFFYEKSLESSYELQFCCLIIDIFTVIVDRWSCVLSQPQWDLILCSSTSWIINIVKQQSLMTNCLSALIFANKSLNLIKMIAKTFKNIINVNTDERYPKDLRVEWNEFHAKNIYGMLFPYYIEIINHNFSHYHEVFATYLCDAISLIPNSLLKEMIQNLPPKDPLQFTSLSISHDLFYLPPQNENFINQFCSLLIHKYPFVSLTSHDIILRLIPLIFTDINQPECNREEEETLLSLPQTMLSILQQCDNVIDAMLSEFAIGDYCCIVEPNTDSFIYTLSYHLIWIEILEIFSHLTPELRSQYAGFLKQSNFLSRMLENIFRLMPVLPATDEDSKILNKYSQPKELSNLLLSINKEMDSSDIQKLSFYLYHLVLCQLPASVRQWWNNLDKRTSDTVNKFTSCYFSSLLCSQELDSVQNADISKFKHKNMTIKARTSVREVFATYTIEDITIELLIQLPQNHPLGPVKIECGKRVGVSNTQWRSWLLQLTTFLTYQNGSILDGLLLWKKNLEKRFEGIDECMICFYVLHGSTYQLPRLQCKTCKKRYHSECLYKWFKMSNNATCPLCRNLF